MATTNGPIAPNNGLELDEDQLNAENSELPMEDFAVDFCSIHSGVKLSAFCSNCNGTVCPECQVQDTHKNHTTISLQQALINKRKLITECLDMAEDPQVKLSERMEELEDMAGIPEVQLKEIRGQIDRSMQMVEKAMRDRKSNLYNELDSLMEKRSLTIKTATEEISQQTEKISSAKLALQALSKKSPMEILRSQDLEIENMKQFAGKAVSTHPSETDTVAFFPTELDQLFSMIHRVGAIAVTGVQAEESGVQGNALKSCQLHEEIEVPLILRDIDGRELSDIEALGFTVQLVSPYERAYHVEVKKCDFDDQLKIKYRIDEEGTYDLSCKFFGEHIKGSPFTVKAGDGNSRLRNSRNNTSSSPRSLSKVRGVSSNRSPSNRRSATLTDDLLFKVGAKGRNNSEFSNPQGVSITKDAKIVIADSGSASIQVFSETGDFLLKFGNRGRDAGQLQRPIDVAETMNGNYLVSDYDNRCISVFTPDGKYYSKFGGRMLMGPKGVCVDKTHRIVVVDNKECCVCVFKATGKFLFKFGTRGTADHQFAGPHYVAVNSQNDIIVTDFHNHSVKCFDDQGTFLFTFGHHGTENGCFHAPTGVAVDEKKDTIIVADWGNSRIQVFDRTGVFLNAVNSNADPLYGIQGLTLMPNERIIAVDSGNFCYKIYKYPLF